MIFCIGIKVDQGLVALADTQIVLGSERISKQKLAARYHDDDSLFTMTSGLLSVRDKVTDHGSETPLLMEQSAIAQRIPLRRNDIRIWEDSMRPHGRPRSQKLQGIYR